MSVYKFSLPIEYLRTIAEASGCDFRKYIDEVIAVARSDARFDGRPFDTLGRVDRDRYLERAIQSSFYAAQARTP